LFPSVLALAFPHPASREESHIIPAKVGHSTPAGQRRATTNFRNALLSQVYYCPCALSCNFMHFFALTKLTALFFSWDCALLDKKSGVPGGTLADSCLSGCFRSPPALAVHAPTKPKMSWFAEATR
jgi:hypothetical protein